MSEDRDNRGRFTGSSAPDDDEPAMAANSQADPNNWQDVPPDDADLNLRYDDDGNLVDPPVIPSYERALQEAHAANDVDQVASVMDDYTDARERLARRRAEREQQEATA